ncbi:substrate-binding domain-containing protein [Heyndrickxia sp. NPDC080065]|uniref:substrate-binding domain-containing protein n=1 Tax=Heyndrickxia sp. NPDC080065 TaxID=3390568 RepID=UPI003CFD6934
MPLVSALSPKLTTVHQEIYEMGRKAVDMLIQQIEKVTKGSVMFEPFLVKRDSTTAAM